MLHLILVIALALDLLEAHVKLQCALPHARTEVRA